MEREKRRKMGLYRLPSCSSHLNGNFHFIITFTFVHHLMYIYIYTHTQRDIYVYIHIYVLLRGEGYERMWSSQTSFSLLWYWKLLQFLHSLSLSLSTYLRDTLKHIHTHYTHSLSLSLSVLSLCPLSSLSFSFAPLLSLCCSLQWVFLQSPCGKWKMEVAHNI